MYRRWRATEGSLSSHPPSLRLSSSLWLVARNASAGLIVSCTVKDTVCAGARGLAAAANGGLARATAHETTPPHFCVSHGLWPFSLSLFFPSSILLLIANWSLCFCFLPDTMWGSGWEAGLIPKERSAPLSWCHVASRCLTEVASLSSIPATLS
ncbi:hypothetical protein GGI42DRAFT_316248 [Trichoderma sp. SZMC 28013]